MKSDRVKTIGTVLWVAGVLSAVVPAAATPPNPDLNNWKGPNNNCYNYAADVKTNDFAQPGGVPWPNVGGNLTVPQWCDKVTNRAQGDGLMPIAWAPGQPIPTPSKGFNLIALGGLAGHKGGNTGPYGDYHWWRLNGDGTWSHKRGETPAKTTYTDGGGAEQQITDPREATQRDGYALCGFMGVGKNPPPQITGTPASPPPGGARVTPIRRSGFPEVPIEIIPLELEGLLPHLPTPEPSNIVPDPLWPGVPAGELMGFGLLAGPGAPLPPYVRVWQGVVAVYDDLDGTVITYFNDDNGLEDFLSGAVGGPTVPTLSSGALVAMAVLVLAAGAIVLRRRRAASS